MEWLVPILALVSVMFVGAGVGCYLNDRHWHKKLTAGIKPEDITANKQVYKAEILLEMNPGPSVESITLITGTSKPGR